MTVAEDDDVLLEIADELYALPLGEFTPARDARAKALKGGDHAGLAGPVKALRKPSLAAWVLNLFARRAGEQVEQVLVVGAALREAQAGMSGPELRELTKQRRQLTAAITTQARSLAREEGVKVTPAVADQVEATLTAAMVSAACGEAVSSGLLVVALSTTGVDEDADRATALAAVAVPAALGHVAVPREAAAPARPDLRVVPDPDAGEKAREAAQDAVDEAEEAVEQARAAHDEAAADVEQLRARQLQIEAEIDELKRRIAELEETYDEVDDELGDAEAVREEAHDTLEQATAERDAAAAVLAGLS
ncbi:hypothetical protein [Nocardioides dongxiaopingii]|uniref:hypothetical protein n=1 Tax=Nocardioides dongxiaopingii TaxID=2576036 RepID=UPI001485BB84|nr:hypothetical protein [Nocardioides dongxiaopingii]